MVRGHCPPIFPFACRRVLVAALACWLADEDNALPASPGKLTTNKMVRNNGQDAKPVVAMFYTMWSKGPTAKAAQRLDRQASSLADKAHFLLVNCSPAADVAQVQEWAHARKIRYVEHFKLLGPAPK